MQRSQQIKDEPQKLRRSLRTRRWCWCGPWIDWDQRAHVPLWIQKSSLSDPWKNIVYIYIHWRNIQEVQRLYKFSPGSLLGGNPFHKSSKRSFFVWPCTPWGLLTRTLRWYLFKCIYIQYIDAYICLLGTYSICHPLLPTQAIEVTTPVFATYENVKAAVESSKDQKGIPQTPPVQAR